MSLASTASASGQAQTQAQALLPPWLHAAHQSVMGMADNQRLPHALLLRSPLGWCETSLASVLACQILELELSLDADEVAHPDLRWLEREEDAQSYKVEQIRDAISFMQRTAQGNGNKVVVVPMAHRMNEASANSLLKTLEEPPPGGHWLLLCNETGQLLPTIRSRCQSVVVTPAPGLDTTGYITDLVAANAPDVVAGINAAKLEMLQFEFLGAPELVAASLVAEEEPVWPFLAGVLSDRNLITSIAERWNDRELAELTASWLRYVHALAADQLPGYAQNSEAFTGQGAVRSSAKLYRFADELQQARALVTFHAGINRRLLLERLLLRWCGLFG